MDNNNNKPKYITALSINGVDELCFEYNEETGLYHWNGDANYAGYTEEELLARQA